MQRRFAGIVAGRADAAVPDVIAERSSRRVITSAFSEGRRFADFASVASRDERDRAGLTIFDVCFTAIFRHGLMNGDPHPGNYLFEPGGRVVFLDFGCVREFDAQHLATWRAMARGLLSDDRAAFREAFLAAGFVSNARRFDWDDAWRMMRFLYEPVLTPRHTFSHEWVRRSFDIMLWSNKNKLTTAMPPAWLFANRLQWGLYSVLATLGASGDFGTPYRAAIASDLI
jgi:predicted unusual protein kinase regulating ubiquinone biosynthesis (AarF/ABC1/UbiB family)